MTGPELLAFAEGIRRYWESKGIRERDLEDVRQVAALTALEVERASGLSIVKARGYYFEAARRRCGVALGKWASPVSMGEKRAGGLDRNNQRLPPESRPRAVDIDGLARSGGDRPDEVLEAKERARELSACVRYRSERRRAA